MSGAKHSQRYYIERENAERQGKRRNSKLQKSMRKSRRERERRAKKMFELYGEEAHSSCGRKFRYRSRHSAIKHIATHASSSPLYVYRCQYCHGWHITSHPQEGNFGADGMPYVPEAASDEGMDTT